MAVRSRRLAGPVLSSAVGVLAYTVPNDRTAIIKEVWLYNNGGGVTTAHISVNGLNSAQRIWSTPVNAGSDARRASELTLNPGDTISVLDTVGTNCRLWLFGALLDGAPS